MNSQVTDELCALSREERLALIAAHRERGVRIPMEDGVFIGREVQIESGALILPNSQLLGKTRVEKGCVIGPGSLLFNVEVGEGSTLNSVQAFDSAIGEGCDLGPFVHVRPNSRIDSRVHLGNFVEVKNSTVGEETSVSHLTYIGDSDVGKGVNFGCGCVTVNFSGREKSRTTVGDHAFIGCNTNLVAPVTVGDYGYIAAGSTITKDVPPNALGIARARQENKEGWVLKRKPYRKKENEV